MALTYERLDATRRIVVTVTGPYATAEILGVVDRQAAEGAWQYALLYDERGMTTVPPAADMPVFVHYVGQLVTNHGPRGPVAVVTDRLTTYGIVRLYSTLRARAKIRSQF